MASIDSLLRRLEPYYKRWEGATEADIADAEKLLEVKFPADYRAFLIWSSGGESLKRQPGTYLHMWPADDLYGSNVDYEITEAIPGVVGIGAGYAEVAYALDYRESPSKPSIIETALGELDPATMVVLANCFEDWIRDVVIKLEG